MNGGGRVFGLAGRQLIERGRDRKLRLEPRRGARRVDQFLIQLSGRQPMTLVGFHLGQHERRFVSGRRVKELADDFGNAVAVAVLQGGFELAARGRTLQQLVGIVAFRRQVADQLAGRRFQPKLAAVVARPLEKRILIAAENAVQECQGFVVFVVGQALAGAADGPRQGAIGRQINAGDGVLIVGPRLVAASVKQLRRLNDLTDGDVYDWRDGDQQTPRR